MLIFGKDALDIADERNCTHGLKMILAARSKSPVTEGYECNGDECTILGEVEEIA